MIGAPIAQNEVEKGGGKRHDFQAMTGNIIFF